MNDQIQQALSAHPDAWHGHIGDAEIIVRIPTEAEVDMYVDTRGRSMSMANGFLANACLVYPTGEAKLALFGRKPFAKHMIGAKALELAGGADTFTAVEGK